MYKGRKLRDFLEFMKLKNFVNTPTREAQYFDKSTQSFRYSKTLIDVVLHNQALVSSTHTIDYPGSDHKIIVALLDLQGLSGVRIAQSLCSCFSSRRPGFDSQSPQVFSKIILQKGHSLRLNDSTALLRAWAVLKMA